MGDATTTSGVCWRRSILKALFSLLLLVVGFVACMIYFGVTISLESERTLQANRLGFRLVEQFVSEHRRWPLSWADLEREKMSAHVPSAVWKGTFGQ